MMLVPSIPILSSPLPPPPIKKVPPAVSLEGQWYGVEADPSSPSRTEVKMCGAISQLSYIPSLERYLINNRDFIFFI
jgi:hypothetical protein